MKSQTEDRRGNRREEKHFMIINSMNKPIHSGCLSCNREIVAQTQECVRLLREKDRRHRKDGVRDSYIVTLVIVEVNSIVVLK
jgi:hypothetical protein